MMKVPETEIRPHALSSGDARGRLFVWGDQLVRAVSAEHAEFYRNLFRRNIVQELVEADLLVTTELTNLQIGDSPLVVKHRKLPFVSYAHEWCAAMLKDAALHLLKLQLALERHGLTLQDAHPWNIVWDGVKPYYVDFCSITEGTFFHEQEFRRFFLNPLRMMAMGHSRVARWLLHDCDLGILDSEVDDLIGSSPVHAIGKIIKTKARSAARKSIPAPIRSALRRIESKLRTAPSAVHTEMQAATIERLTAEIAAIPVVLPRTDWSNYYDDSFPSFTPDADWTPKHHSMLAVLDRVKPRSLLDLGSNRGWFCQLAARHGIPVVATDLDEPSITKLFYDAKVAELPVQPLLMDFRRPTPDSGIGRSWGISALERFSADLVTALALVHHLVFRNRLRFDIIAQGLADIAPHWLLVEFIGPEDQYVREWWTTNYDWYHLGAFEIALAPHFRIVDSFPSNLPHRVLLLCERVSSSTRLERCDA